MLSGHTQLTTQDNKVIILGGNWYKVDPMGGESDWENTKPGQEANLDIYE